MVKSCFVPRKRIVHSQFPHKPPIYATILKSIKNADSFFYCQETGQDLSLWQKNTRKGETTLKKMDFKKVNNLIAKTALAVTKANVNSTCPYSMHQPKLPEAAKKLRKF